jgi:hypothetical protein
MRLNIKKVIFTGILSLALLGFVGCESENDIDPDDAFNGEETPAEEEDFDD